MQISQVYSNRSDLFTPIYFNFGENAELLNVIMGDIKHPKDSSRSSHNLGKTTLIHLLEFLLLKGTSVEQFLVKHKERFTGVEFFIEIKLNSGDFATIKRSPDEPDSVNLKRHALPSNFINTADDEWDHAALSRKEALTLLDGWLDLQVLKPYDYRMAITYFLRSQGDYGDELQLAKFDKGRDLYWKPFVAHLFGFDEEPIQQKYKLDESIQSLKERQADQQAEVQFQESDLPELSARIKVLEQHADTLESQLDAFSFDAEERRIMQNLVNEVEEQIAQINERLYNIRYDLHEIDIALEHKDKFDLKEVETIFNESKLYFSEQLKKPYEDLVTFNKKVTHERNTALRARRKTLLNEEQELSAKKSVLDEKRKEQLKVLKNTDTFDKFKTLQKELTQQRAQLVYLEQQRQKLEKVVETARQVRESERERGRVVDDIKAMVEKPTSTFERFSKIFNEYCQRVLNCEGIFYFYVNSSNNFDYNIGLGLPTESGKASSQSEGSSFKKLICALFDLALLKVYEDTSFFHFVYHDGIFEALDDRKKLALLEVIREQTASKKTQYILTLIASDLPRSTDDKVIEFTEDEVVLRLHDGGQEGRLFKMAEF